MVYSSCSGWNLLYTVREEKQNKREGWGEREREEK
jgi:hypothetical protein